MPASDELLDLLGSDLNRQILVVTSGEPRSADAVAECCDASLPTVYRHVDDLESAGLLIETTQYDEAGNHYNTYAAALQELSVRLVNGELTVELRAGESPEESHVTADGVAVSGTNPDDPVSRRDMQE